MARVSKKDVVHNYLKDHTGLTSNQAVVELGVGDLAGTVRDLRNIGLNIISIQHKGLDRYGNKCRYVEYRLVKKVKKNNKLF